jgi:hypothetical protein
MQGLFAYAALKIILEVGGTKPLLCGDYFKWSKNMDPTTKWALIGAAIGAVPGGAAWYIIHAMSDTIKPYKLLVLPVVTAVIGALAVSGAFNFFSDAKGTNADPAAACKGGTFTQQPNGSYTCTYKPS